MKSAVRLYRNLPRTDTSAPSAVTIGNFDGVHRGHQAILDQVCRHARMAGLEPTVMTFVPHPRAYFARRAGQPDRVPAQISSLRDRVAQLTVHGIRQIVIQRFDHRLAQMDAEAFVEDLLIRGLNTRCLYVGSDFRFGRQRTGDIALLRKLATIHDFTVRTIDNVNDGAGRRVSSSALRAALAAADLAHCQEFLGRSYVMSGHVVRGQQLGGTLGFPTLNLRVPTPCAARFGVYVVRVHGLGDTTLPGVASLGIRPAVTWHGTPLLEVHILDRQVQAYGKLVCVEFLQFLRNEEPFPDLTTLTAAIRQDAQDARDYFATHGL